MKLVGGYVTAWNDARYFQPKELEDVLVHLKGNASCEWRFGCYMDNGEYQQIYFDEHYSVPYTNVDYWMRIPPIPDDTEQKIPYIVGSDYSAEEKLFSDLEERRKALEKEKYGMTSEEIAEDVRKTIEIRMKMHKTEIE